MSKNAQFVLAPYLGQYSLATIAPWADQYRTTPQGAWSASCHYLSLPSDATKIDLKTDCPGLCIVKSVVNYTRILQKDGETRCEFKSGEEPCALEFLVHFTGDIHQPLHVSYESDVGGNEVKVAWFGEKKTNLHAVWDEFILSRWTPHWMEAVDRLEEILAENPSLISKALQTMDPFDWATESFDLLGSVYDFSDSSTKDGELVLGEAYYERNLPIVQTRLIIAGIRLGEILNQLFPQTEIIQ